MNALSIGREPGSNVARIEGLATSCPVCSLSGSVALDFADPENELLPTTLTDGEGITTALSYDSLGQLVSRIEVANDPNGHPDLPRETTWEYHPTFPAFPTAIEGPMTMGQAASRRVDLVYDGNERPSPLAHRERQRSDLPDRLLQPGDELPPRRQLLLCSGDN